jgi:hypothetical protein
VRQLRRRFLKRQPKESTSDSIQESQEEIKKGRPRSDANYEDPDDDTHHAFEPLRAKDLNVNHTISLL